MMFQKRIVRFSFVFLMLIGFLIADAFVVGFMAHSQTKSPNEPIVAHKVSDSAQPISLMTRDAGLSVADIAESAVNSVVNISSTKLIKFDHQGGQSPLNEDPFFRYFFGPQQFQNFPRERRERSLGSGVIVSADGIVITNNHVVDHADQIQVTLADGRDFEAKMVGTDPKTDVAVIRIANPPKDLKAVEFANSDALRLGEVVLAIGNPFGLSHTVTMGIISAKGRANVGIVDYEDFIQTDAAINPGNSGGALINMRGELVGINTAIVSRSGGYQGIGFAIPSNMAQSVMNSLLTTGKVVRGWLGVGIQDINRDLAKALDLPSQKGVLISDVMHDSPAQKAGLKRGDVITKLDNQHVDTTGHLRNLVASRGANTPVNLTIIRDGKEMQVNLKLGELSEKSEQVASTKTDKGVLDGLTLAPLSSATRKEYDIPKEIKSGLVITAVEPGSRAHQAGLQRGDAILQINRRDIDSVESFNRIYVPAGDTVLLLVYRQGTTMYLVLQK